MGRLKKPLQLFVLFLLLVIIRAQDDQSSANPKDEVPEIIPTHEVQNGEKSGRYLGKEPEEMEDHSRETGASPVEVQKSEEKPKIVQQQTAGRYSYRDFPTDYLCSTQRYAPPPSSQTHGATGYTVTEMRLRQIRSEFLYCFFDEGADGNEDGDYQKDIHNSIPQVHKNFNFQLPFYGFRFNYTRLSMHGFIEFSDPPEHYTYPLVFPNKDWPKKNDPSFIGMFFSKMRIGKVRNEDVDQRKPGVYFRLERDLQTRSDQYGVEMREKLMWDIRTGVVGANTFEPKHAITVTWKNMSFSGGIDNSLYKTNTFQLVLATDEVYTYAILNYAELQWLSHTEAGGDTTNGEGGVPAYVGFNAGNGTQSFEYHPYSQSMTIRDLVGRGWANGFPGRHIFRIDEKIMLGTCNKDIAGANLPLIFAPESGNMLGGTVVNITGPCFVPNEKIKCRFDTEDVIGTFIDTNRAICVQPFVMAEGYVKFEIATSDSKYNWKGKFFIETPATSTERITFHTKDIHDRAPAEIKMSWNAHNLTTNTIAPIRISLWGYKETTTTPKMLYIDLIEESAVNSGEYTIVPGSYRNRDNGDLNELQFGFIMINLTNPLSYQGFVVNPVLWSKPIPLAWYFNAQWERQYGSKWSDKLCDKWVMNDRYLKNFAGEVPQCPCTLEHALTDKGRYLPDFDCDKDANPDCFYHKGAVHCVRTGAPGLEGSEQQCCYDKNGYMMLTYDQQWGSRPHRSHNLGYLPWNEANKVPTLSHWYHDMIPFYICCLWQEESAVGCETYRFERRPTQDCVAYQSPSVATVFGDPHIITFDDLEYTFNGKGEFVLLHANSEKTKIDVQGRFEQLPRNIYGEVKATQLTAVAARDNSSAIIEVRVRPPEAQWRYRLDVLADGKKVYFDRESLRIQHFPGVTVYAPTYILNQSEIIIMFESGAGVEIVENKGFMTTRVYLPWTFINQTRGLFGNWSFNMEDDFTKPDGTVVNANVNDFERIHKDFAIYWLLEDQENKDVGNSLFYREYGRTASFYANKTFEPEWRKSPNEFIPPNRTQIIQNAEDYCGTSYQCKYDYAMSLNRDMAHFTKNYQDSFVEIKTKNYERVISCGVLETPRFGRKSNFLYVPGTKVTFECSQGFVLIGDQRRQCMPEGRWNTPEYGYTECLRAQEYSSRQAGMTAGIIMIVILPILIAFFAIWFCCIRKRRHKESTSSWQFSPVTKKDASLLGAPDDFDSGLGGFKSSDRTSSSKSSGGSKKRRLYDESYRTREPLPGRPNSTFDDREWELDEDARLSMHYSQTSPSDLSSGVKTTPAPVPLPITVVKSDSARIPTVKSDPVMAPPTVKSNRDSDLGLSSILRPKRDSDASSSNRSKNLNGSFSAKQQRDSDLSFILRPKRNSTSSSAAKQKRDSDVSSINTTNNDLPASSTVKQQRDSDVSSILRPPRDSNAGSSNKAKRDSTASLTAKQKRDSDLSSLFSPKRLSTSGSEVRRSSRPQSNTSPVMRIKRQSSSTTPSDLSTAGPKTNKRESYV